MKQPKPASVVTLTEPAEGGPKLVSIARAGQIMKEVGIAYTESELETLTAFVGRLAEMTASAYDRHQNSKQQQSENAPYAETTSLSLHPRLYRRTG